MIKSWLRRQWLKAQENIGHICCRRCFQAVRVLPKRGKEQQCGPGCGGRPGIPKLPLGTVVPWSCPETQQATAVPSGLKPLVFLTGEGAVVGALLCLLILDRAARCARPWAPALRVVELYVATYLIPEPGQDTRQVSSMSCLLWQPLLQTRKWRFVSKVRCLGQACLSYFLSCCQHQPCQGLFTNPKVPRSLPS